jgi:hypothetical protein
VKTVFLAFCLAAFSAISSSADTIVDSGQPEHGPPPFSGGALWADWFWAVGMDLDEPTTITSIGIYMGVEATGELVISIVEDKDGLPADDAAVFSRTVRLEGERDSPATWHTLSGIDPTLAQGAYWVVFEVPSGGGLYAVAPKHDSATETPYVHRKRSEKWSRSTGLNLGIRIEGATAGQ